jgi:hypothetical protein
MILIIHTLSSPALSVLIREFLARSHALNSTKLSVPPRANVENKIIILQASLFPSFMCGISLSLSLLGSARQHNHSIQNFGIMSQGTLGRFIFMIASSKNTKRFGRDCFFTYLLSDDFTFWQQIKIFIKIDKHMMGTTQSGGITKDILASI